MMAAFTVSKNVERLKRLSLLSDYLRRVKLLAIVLVLSACATWAPGNPQGVSTTAAASSEIQSRVISQSSPGFQNVDATASLSPSATPTQPLDKIAAGSPSPAVSAQPGSELPSSTPTTFLPIITAGTPPAPIIRFAVIGDYGGGGIPEADVAALVLAWQPDLILTTGDNNYPSGSAETIDANIGQFYHTYIYPYFGEYGSGALENRFFPTLGNHDWNTDQARPYLDYFTLPGNERYYDFTWGPVHFFALDSDSREPDGVGLGSLQAAWLKERLAASETPWQIVYFHHPPYSSGVHGSVEWMRWPFAEWGADAVLAGHDHTYERIHRDGIVYLVNGLGGGSKYRFFSPVDGSQVRYNLDYGAQLVEASPLYIRFQFVNRSGELIDEFTLSQP